MIDLPLGLHGVPAQAVFGAHLRPQLTTIELPHYTMGQWAVQFLFDHADGSYLDPIQQTIACPLIERASV